MSQLIKVKYQHPYIYDILTLNKRKEKQDSFPLSEVKY